MDATDEVRSPGETSDPNPIVRAAAGGHDEDFFGSIPIWTPEIHSAIQSVAEWIRCDHAGGAIWGLPGTGKSEFAAYLAAVASSIFGATVFAIRIEVHQDAGNDPNRLMMDWGRQIKAPGYHHHLQAVRKGRFVDMVVERASAGGSNRLLIIVDQAHRFSEDGLELLTALSDEIRTNGLRPFVLLVGQLQLRELLKTFDETLALQMTRRYFLGSHTYRGIRLDDLDETLSSFDDASTPSVTQRWLPHRAAEHWSLQALGTPMRKGVTIIAEDRNLTRGVRLPMTILRPCLSDIMYRLIAMGSSQQELDHLSCVDVLKAHAFDRLIQFYVEE